MISLRARQRRLIDYSLWNTSNLQQHVEQASETVAPPTNRSYALTIPRGIQPAGYISRQKWQLVLTGDWGPYGIESCRC